MNNLITTPSQSTKTLNSAMVKARHVVNPVQVKCRVLLKRQTLINIESTIFTTMRTFHVHRLHTLRLYGSPALL